MNPAIKVLMKLTKNQLLYKAREYRLVGAEHNKTALAKAIAKYESDKFEHDWKVISRG